MLVSPRLAPFMIGPWIAAANERLLGPVWIGRTVMLSWEPMFVAAGAITGWHVGWSMLLGSVGAWMIFVPVLQHQGVIEGSGYGALVQWTLWGGTACMVSSGLLSFLMEWRSAVRAFKDLGMMFSRRGRTLSEQDAIETPTSWFAFGQIVSLVGGFVAPNNYSFADSLSVCAKSHSSSRAASDSRLPSPMWVGGTPTSIKGAPTGSSWPRSALPGDSTLTGARQLIARLWS